MIDEKILENEKISEENLEKISGGTLDQSEEDMLLFVKNGIIKPFQHLSQVEIQKEVKHLWKNIGIECLPSESSQNEYYYRNKKITRDKAIEKLTLYDKD